MATLAAHGPARPRRTACSRASCRSRRTTRSPRAGELAEVQPGLAFVDAFANSSAVDTDDGLVVVDTSGVFHAKAVHETLRRWSASRLDTAVFTHGHIDHVFGVDLYEEEARANGWAPPRVIAHELVADRFDRYRSPPATTRSSTSGSSRRRDCRWPIDYRYPDETYRHDLDARRRRRALRAAPRPRRDRRRHVGVGARSQGAVRRRPVHLGVAELRQPAEGAALPARLGARVPHDGRARRRGAAARSRPADRRRRPRAPGAHRRRGAARVAARPDARADERRRAPRRHRAHGARARAPARTPVPAAGLRRARVRRAQHLALLRRLVRRQSRRTSSRRRRPRSRAELAEPRRRRGAARRPRARELAADGRPPPRRPPRRARGAGRARRRGRAPGARRGVRRPRRRRSVDDVEGHLLLGRARVAHESKADERRGDDR